MKKILDFISDNIDKLDIIFDKRFAYAVMIIPIILLSILKFIGLINLRNDIIVVSGFGIYFVLFLSTMILLGTIFIVALIHSKIRKRKK